MPPHEPTASSRFLPGQMLDGRRYRIIRLVGKGAMGEVYCADDLKLGQQVALKFLPQAREHDEVWLRRFTHEVGIAQHLSHPHVCRIHDVREAAGTFFLSMEHIEGEDLFRLLQRIGPLPSHKALEIARQLCAGLAAIHDQGILHRDLKPSNVMIDENGRAKITDFGLAGWVGRIRDPGSGTLPYMAPEQLAAAEVTVRSDLYALGLVLYELFTAERAFEGDSREGLIPPSGVVEGLDPGLERVILHCLEAEPGDRPASVREVAEALPEPLPPPVHGVRRFLPPEALLLGQKSDALRPAAAWAGLAALLAGLVLGTHLAASVQLPRLLHLDEPPQVLVKRARDLVRAFGYEDPPGDHVYGFSFDPAPIEARVWNDASPRRWRRLASDPRPAITFWYRQSPGVLIPVRAGSPVRRYGDPPASVAGMVGLHLDARGRLQRLDAVPAELEVGAEAAAEPDWAALLAAAGLGAASLEEVEPAVVPAVFADRRRAWEGVHPAPEAGRVRIEAAAFRGRPVAFRLLGAGVRTGPADAAGAPPADVASRFSWTLFSLWFAAALVGGVLLARRNLRRDCADRQAALRLAIYLAAARMLVWLFGAPHAAWAAELESFWAHLAWSLFSAGLAWVLYVALEPLLRRDWQGRMASWVRLMHGRFRDPRVGRDTLFGALAGVAVVLWAQLYALVPGWLGLPPPRPDRLSPLAWQVLSSWVGQQLESLRGLRHAMAVALHAHVEALLVAFFAIAGLFLLCLLLRRTWAAVAAALSIWSVLLYPAAGHPAYDLLAAGVAGALWLAIMMRVGFLAMVVATSVAALLGAVPLTLDLSAWYADRSAVALLLILGAGLYGFIVSLGGRPAFPDR